MIELTLPLPPNRANAREHWRVTHRKKKAYYAVAQANLYIQVGTVEGLMPPVFANGRRTLTATLYVKKKFDPDNRVALLKWPIDCLVSHGLLVDDSDEWLDFTEIPKQVIDRENMRVVIRLGDTQ